MKKLAKHHEVDFRFTVKALGIKDQQSFMDLLEYKDMETKREKRLKGYTRPNERENGSFGWREPQRQEKPSDQEREKENQHASAGGAGENSRFQQRGRYGGDNRNWKDGHNYPPRRSEIQALDKEVQENPNAACGVPTEN